MQILVFVVLAVIYALGSIAKARANKIEQEDEKQLPLKPGRKPPEGKRDLQKQPLQQRRRPVGPLVRKQRKPQVQFPRRKVARPQPATQKPVAKKEQPTPVQTIEMPEFAELPLLSRQIQPMIQELPELTSETLKKLEEKRVAVPVETSQIKYFGEPLLDYEDTDELKRAILHYEILGKPLSLRGPSEHIIGL
jgi:hypothetical protein